MSSEGSHTPLAEEGSEEKEDEEEDVWTAMETVGDESICECTYLHYKLNVT